MWKLYTYIHTQYTHTQYGIIAIKNNEIRSFAATWMDLEISILSDVIQTEKNKLSYDIPYCGTYRKNKKDTNRGWR